MADPDHKEGDGARGALVLAMGRGRLTLVRRGAEAGSGAVTRGIRGPDLVSLALMWWGRADSWRFLLEVVIGNWTWRTLKWRCSKQCVCYII